MPARHFSKLLEAAQTSADNWPTRRPVTARQSNEHERYDTAAERLQDDIAKNMPIGTGTEALRNPTPIGLRVLFRTCYIGAVLSRDDEIESAALVCQLLRSDESFSILETLMTSPDPFATFLRERIGISPAEALQDAEREHWELSDTGLNVPAMDKLVAESKRTHTWPDRDAMCAAHRARIVKPLFHAVATICERDKNLFARSLR